MRTILYQPVYINPQAYFVFPSLYHIEKGDSYVEPAVYTGQLLIDVVDGSASSVIIKDTKQVDFSDYAGKHIRISQYTDEGAVVLGEWLIPGVPIPQWFKDSIVCWYSPRKQGLTEYDVIESYAEDFTTWIPNFTNAEFTFNKQTINVTGGITTNYFLSTNHEIPVTFDMYLYAEGIEKNNQIRIIWGTPYGKWVSEWINNGINKIHITESKRLGFEIHTVGECNIKITQLPTSKAKDFSANGHDLFLYKFKGKLNSGIGLYHADFTEWANNNSNEVSPEQVVFTTVGTKGITLRGTKTNSINIQVKGFSDKVRYLRLGYNENGVFKEISVFKDGIYTIPGSELETSGQLSHINCSLKEDSKVTVTQIPDYPNQLCYNGSSYGVAYGLPILNDYTIIADRTWFKDKVTSQSYFIDKKRAFDFEKTQLGINYSVSSYAASTTIDLQDSGISYQTKTSYNGQHIDYHSNQADNSNTMYIGTTREDIGKQGIIGCHGDILLFNRTLTDDEITRLKETIFNNN